jgi:O-antigen/teichoic acid export membrane protein
LPLKRFFSANDKTIITLMFFSIVGYVLLYVFNLVLAHYLNPVRLGECNLAIRVLDILASVALLGTNVSSRRFLSRFIHAYDEQNLKLFIKWNMHLISYSFIFCIALALCSYIVMHGLHIWQFKHIKTYHMAIYMLWVAPLAALFLLLNSYLLCANQIIFANSLSNMKVVFYILFFLLLSFVAAPDYASLTVSSIFFLSFLILIFIEFQFITRFTPILFKQIVQAMLLKGEQPIKQDWLTVSLRMAMNNILYLFLTTLDLILIQFISVNKASVGLYAVALTIVSVILIIPKAIQTTLKSEIGPLIESKSGRAKLQSKIKKLNRYTVGMILLISSVIILFSNQLLLHFGAVYLQAKPALIILVIATVVGAYSQSATSLITYSGQEKLLLKMSGLEIVVLILLGVPLTFFEDFTGTAIATLLAMLFKACIFHVEAYRKLGINTLAL